MSRGGDDLVPVAGEAEGRTVIGLRLLGAFEAVPAYALPTVPADDVDAVLESVQVQFQCRVLVVMVLERAWC